MKNILKENEYNEYTGTNLTDELKAKILNADSLAAEHFIMQIEEFLMTKYRLGYGWNGELETENQVKCFKKAVIYQIMYELQNASLWNDSGYSMTSGLIISPEALERIGVSQITHNNMRLGGMANIRGR